MTLRRFAMKSYILAITVTMFLSALFAFQNIGDVTVRFLIFEWMFPQGVWEVLVFCAGSALMWIFSIFSPVSTETGRAVGGVFISGAFCKCS